MCNNMKFSLPKGSEGLKEPEGPKGYDKQELITRLSDLYLIKKERSILNSFAIYDTFDWRLFNKSFVLYKSGSKLFLRKLYKTTIIQSAEITSMPVFIRDFPNGKLKEELAPILKMRALLKLVAIHSLTTPYRILNLDKKTVAQLACEEIRPFRNHNSAPLAAYLWLKPVKGYPKYSRKLAKLLLEAGFTVSKNEDIYFKALEIADKTPGSYSAKLNIHLDPDIPSQEATKIILRFLLHVMEINKAYIKKDLDTEFLHDFRVAVRRTRSALNQIKNVFSPETNDRFKRDFAFIGKLSNQLRDLDVYLLNEDAYKEMLPIMLRSDIDPLFDYLRKNRSRAIQGVIRNLTSKKYSDILRDWDAFLNEPVQDSPFASDAAIPIGYTARKRIYKRYLSTVKTGNLILENTRNEDTQDEMLHNLRIECKKLRYLMEFFTSLFPLKKIKTLIGQLKKLQDNLGNFNDLCVQEEYLINIAKEIPIKDHLSKKVLVAIGSLIGTLGRRKHALKSSITKTFSNYASPENKKLFQELFTLK